VTKVFFIIGLRFFVSPKLERPAFYLVSDATLNVIAGTQLTLAFVNDGFAVVE
jgi:hypothetical protein